jgi:tetratricopeptide (TPR) repeat protein
MTRLKSLIAGPAGARAIPVAVALVVFAASSPALLNTFVDWDDAILFRNNAGYRGLGWTQIRWMFTNVMMGHWVPLTWLTHGVDYVLWEMNPAGYHLVNLLFHAANAAVFFLIARRLLAAATALSGVSLRVAGATAALFFGLHPLRAESVAWVTERRDVVSGLFFLLAVLAYLRAASSDDGRRRWKLAVSAGCFVLAFTAKSMVMTLPVVLVLLDIYPLRRLDGRWWRWREEPARSVWKEKIPFVAIAAAGAVVAYYAQAANSFITSFSKVPWSSRPSIVAYGLWFYLSKTAMPSSLSPLYELPAEVDPLHPTFLVPALAVAAITTAAIALRRRWPAGLAAWVYYAVVLAPVVGIVHSGHQLAHDRYSYLACLSWALLVGAGAGAAVRAWQRGAVRPAVGRLAVGACALWIAALGFLTWNQVQIWRDTDSLWRHALESQPECTICQNNLGALLNNAGHLVQAKERFERVLELRPDRVRAHQNLALVAINMGQPANALDHYRRVLAAEPDDVESRNNLSVALTTLGRYREALWHLEYALRVQPESAMLHTNLGMVTWELGDPERALAYLERAVALKPDAPQAHLALGLVLAGQGRLAEATEEYEVLRRLDPKQASLLGPALLQEW